MNIPMLAQRFYQVLVGLGVVVVYAAIMQPTQRYEEWEDARAELRRQNLILEAEKNYLAGLEELITVDASTDDRKLFLLSRKETAILEAEVSALAIRVDDLRGRWAKARLWSILGGLAGFVVIVAGLAIWRAHDGIKQASA